jgi:hypothetical protein
MATLVATRHNPVIRDFYERLLLKKVVLVACMRKLLVILNAMIRNNQTWQAPTESSAPPISSVMKTATQRRHFRLHI